MIIITIDPGVNGAAVAWDSLSPGIPPQIQKMAEGELAVLHFLEGLSNGGRPGLVAYMEKVGGFIPKGENQEGQPGSRMFTFGNAYGVVRGMLLALGIETIFVLPQQWQRGIPGRKGMSYSQRKTALRNHAQKLFPGLKVSNAEADALGILHYAKAQQNLGANQRDKETFEELDQNGAKFLLPKSKNKQIGLAIEWCETNNYNVPKKGSKEFNTMFEYWLQNYSYFLPTEPMLGLQ